MLRFVALVACVLGFGLGAGLPAKASTIVAVAAPNPTPSSEIGVRLRWGGQNFEASVYDSSANGNGIHQSPQLNPTGPNNAANAWRVGQAHAFEIRFSSATGRLWLGVDFNLDNDFADAQESGFREVFSAPGQVSYQGFAFDFLSISGNEGGSTARSSVGNLIINGTSFAEALAPGGGMFTNFYRNAGGAPLANLVLTGNITFANTGTGQERPSWDFRLLNAVVAPAPVPEPASLALLSAGLLGLAALRRRRRAG